MQFIRNGPDIPERLLQAHEDGGVVFFCGAGISYPAGLPGFSELVERLYADLAPIPNAVQKAAIKAKQFDTALGLLEGDISGGRETMRRKLADILTPDLSAPKDMATHEALLTLGTNREGQTRLITTNFDRLFEEVIEAQSLSTQRFEAPLLPIPKKRWNGLVYLHGLLSIAPTADQLDRLVISSGDFGLAYLTERWAARFVSELFRNYTVCFVGYSINDPVLRYMMDALAADRLLGESPPEMFAFGDHSEGEEEEMASEWRAKNVTPVLYNNDNRHDYLHKTLHAWADTYRDGVRGKERIVVECAMARPMASTRQDDFVGRLLWALSDPSGLPAQRFADLDPVPPLDWLEPLSEERYRHDDLSRFGVPPDRVVDEALAFSLIKRPSPSPLATRMCVADASPRSCDWDDVMKHLARWLIRHLDNPALLLKLASLGGQLHEKLIYRIQERLDELIKLEREANTIELTRIRENAPDAIPRPEMRTLWNLLLTGRGSSSRGNLGVHRWCNSFKRDGLTIASRLELREKLTPRVFLREPFPWPTGTEVCGGTERIERLVNWEIVLSKDHVRTSLGTLCEDVQWTDALPDLLADFSALLRDALDLMRELGGADDRRDRSHIYQPSISDHPQNTDSRDWTILIDLTRDAWLAMATRSPELAALTAESWWHTPYPIFRRLAFFAAANEAVIPHRRACEWLLADSHWWLWSPETKHEVIRLLVALVPQLDKEMLQKIERAILAGPPQDIKDNMQPEDWAGMVDRQTWLRLARIAETGTILGSAGTNRLDALSTQYPNWELAPDQRDEFSFWMQVDDVWNDCIATPQRRRELTEWLRQHASADHWQQDDWQQRCGEDFPATTCALYALAKEGVWPIDRWREALQAWSAEKLRERSWRYMASVLRAVPDEDMLALAHGIGWWLKAIAKTFEGQDETFLTLCERLLAQDHEREEGIEDVVGHAINHPVGLVTQALLNWWYRQSLEDGQGLPARIKPTFTDMCDIRIDKFRHGRVLLTAHAITLFRVDRDWTTLHLLPLFDWQRPDAEPRVAWKGFLWSPRLYCPWVEALKPAFLNTAHHYTELGAQREQYASLLTFAALNPGDTFNVAELARATYVLPPEALHDAAKALVRALDGAAEQRAIYWTNRVVPYLTDVWPKTLANNSSAISESLGHLCIAAKDAFPEALHHVRAWLQPPAQPDYLVHRLFESGLCSRYPEEALDLLDRVIGNQTRRAPPDLGDCLKAIQEASLAVETDHRYVRLLTYSRQHGQG